MIKISWQISFYMISIDVHYENHPKPLANFHKFFDTWPTLIKTPYVLSFSKSSLSNLRYFCSIVVEPNYTMESCHVLTIQWNFTTFGHKFSVWNFLFCKSYLWDKCLGIMGRTNILLNKVFGNLGIRERFLCKLMFNHGVQSDLKQQWNDYKLEALGT